MCISPVPASDKLVALYAAYLARRLRPSSIKQYLNVIRLLHIESDYSNPCQDNWLLKSTIRGIEKTLGVTVNRKTPIHPLLLMDIRQRLQLEVPLQAMFWAAALVLFFGTFRKSNLISDTVHTFSASKQFVRSDFTHSSNGSFVLKVKWSKTIQCKDRCFFVMLPKVPHVLCPVHAVLHAFSIVPLPLASPAFVQDLSGTPLTGTVFNSMLKSVVSRCGLDPVHFSSHSFRRGSATWALQCGVPGEVVKLMGDWRSNVYMSYLDNVPQHLLDHYRQVCSLKLPMV